MHDVASNITFHAEGRLSLHGGMAHNSHQSRLNVWSYEIDGHALSLMANKGPLFENGNVFAWYGIKSKVAASTVFQETSSDLHNSRSVSVYQMDFPSASDKNYVLIKDAVREKITVFSLCFWAKFLRAFAGVFVYSSPKHDDEIGVFLFEDFVLDLSIKLSGKNGPVISSHTSWHFYCLQWRSSDGLIQIYQDGKNLWTRIESLGYTIPSKGIVVLGQELDGYGSRFDSNQAFHGSLAGLNLWSQFLTANIIQGMASGVLNVNGNLLQFRNFRNHTFGIVTVRHGSEVEIPEYQVQSLRDQWCAKNISEVFTYARFVLSADPDGYRWRCVAPAAMLDENMCYNITKSSSLYYAMDTNEDIFGNN
ncbi:neuronal pentraxin-2-like [Dendronephthya gigantea]|uniref:neuronal pentraxin-2-like n=1 Tax=Dendronephthya gigantea TaxID=151771 RepID=UPI00106963FC|nr:neuronal pentraxin-2-like [Dendronephthya gigantea]